MRVLCTGELHKSGGPGRFILSRAEDALDDLIRAYGGKVQLIYLDPPFGTGDTFHMRFGSGKKSVRVPVFTDQLDEADYDVWMQKILSGCHKLLTPDGSLYLHIDYRKSAKMRILLDEIFGEKNFMNEIVWCYKSGGRSKKFFPRKHDNILFYRKSAKVYFDISAVGRPRGPEKRNHMKRFISDDGRICFSIRSGGKTYIYYEDTPVYPTDVWTDIEHLQQKDRERVGYATQKPERLLNRILLASSKPGALVMDLFSGSGTTAAVASKLGRRFVAVDASPFSLYTLRARQLKTGSEFSFLEGSHEMHLSYPADETPAGVEYDFNLRGAKTELIVKRAEFDGKYPLVYAALGEIEDGCFLPGAVTLSPKLPIKLAAEISGTPVLQIVDALGRQAFFTIV